MNRMLRVSRFFHHRPSCLSFLSAKLIFFLQPILFGMAVRTTAFEENLIGALLNLTLRWPPRSRRSFSEDDTLHFRCVLFLCRAFRHGYLLYEGRESTVGGNSLLYTTSSPAPWPHRRNRAPRPPFSRARGAAINPPGVRHPRRRASSRHEGLCRVLRPTPDGALGWRQAPI